MTPTRRRSLPKAPGHAEVLDRVAAGAARDSGVPADLLGDFLREATTAIAGGRRLGSDRVALYSRYGADAAVRNIELAALVDLYLSAAWRLWREIPAILPGLPDSAAPFVAAGDGMLRTSDDVVAAVAHGYQQAREVLLLKTASARRDFIDDLFANVGAPGELQDRAEAFGLRLTGTHAVGRSPAGGAAHRRVASAAQPGRGALPGIAQPPGQPGRQQGRRPCRGARGGRQRGGVGPDRGAAVRR